MLRGWYRSRPGPELREAVRRRRWWDGGTGGQERDWARDQARNGVSYIQATEKVIKSKVRCRPEAGDAFALGVGGGAADAGEPLRLARITMVDGVENEFDAGRDAKFFKNTE